MREYVRCSWCLDVRCLERRLPAAVRCGACAGPIESLGAVVRVLGSSTPCDARCTSALGPVCSCSCQGKNHGTALLVRVTTPLPVRDPVHVDALRRMATEFVHLEETVRGRAISLDRRPKKTPAQWQTRDALWTILLEARRSRSHKKRMELLRDAARLSSS